MGQVYRLVLVAITAQCVLNRSLEIRFQNFCASQLSNLLCRFADGQVARARLAVLYLASCGQSKSLLGGLMSLLFGHFNTKAF